MTPQPELYTGHDCSKRASKPNLTLRLASRRFVIYPEQEIYLTLIDVHQHCFPSCYNWHILKGGGRLLERSGTTVRYVGPKDNKNCENSAIIEVYCVFDYLDTAFVTINKFRRNLCEKGFGPYRTVPPIALSYLSGEIHEDLHSGTMIPLGDGRFRLADEYLTAAYKTKYYDCAGQKCWEQNAPYVRKYGTSAPVTDLKKLYGHQVGTIIDMRKDYMKKEGCCPILLVMLEYELLKAAAK